jgi:hypothetical protein
MSARSDSLGPLQAAKQADVARAKKLFDVHCKLDISPLTEDGLRQVITRPAALLGVSFKNGLDQALLAATRTEIGGLPLLSYTLETVWQEMQTRDNATPVLQWSAPEGEGIDLARKLADRADAFVERYANQQHIIRRLFCVHLAHVPAQGDPTQQRAFLDELSEEEQALVQALADREQRVLVTGEVGGQSTAEVAPASIPGEQLESQTPDLGIPLIRSDRVML